MRSIFVCILMTALLGSVICFRRRRQAPVAGAPGGIKTPGMPLNMEDGMDVMMGDLENQQSFGVPINPMSVNKISKGDFSLKDISDISNPSMSNVNQLMNPPQLAVDEADAGKAA